MEAQLICRYSQKIMQKYHLIIENYRLLNIQSCPYPIITYQIIIKQFINMQDQEELNFFRSKIKKKINNQEQDYYGLLQKQLTPIARGISYRAILFLHKLFSNFNRRTEIQESVFNWTYSIKNPIASPICSKIMNQKQNSISYRCYDCIQSFSSCICQDCFARGDHKGHNYVQYGAVNGCCDCGNQQSWNPKTFCHVHIKGGQLKEEIDPKTRKQFIQQYTLAFYVFFALNQFDLTDTIKSSYGTKLFASLIENLNKNYQMKILGYELFQVVFSNKYPPLNENNQFSILQKIFRNSNISNMEQFCQLLFQIFPVEQSRIIVIKQYFRKIRNMELTSEHPLSNINFQYMTCAKIITKLIKNKELQPLYLNRQKCPKNIQYLPFIFCQYYWDLDYINMMKSAKQYHILHLKNVNVAQMAFYRQYGNINFQQTSEDLNLDEIYLKLLGHMIKDVINEKQILMKCIRQLFYYIEHEGINKFSQAQERAFAMFTVAYFEGDIAKLFQKETRMKFVQKICILSDQTFAKMLKHAIKTSLKSCSLYGILPTSKSQKYTRYFLKNNPQNNLNYFLDLIYHKILMIISMDYLQYDKVINETFIELIDLNKVRTDKNLSFIMEAEYQERYIQLNKYQINMEGSQIIKRAIKILNTITMVNLDEIVVSNYLKINQKQKIYDFYSRLLSSFKQLSIKQFKALAISIINNEQIFEQFIKDRTILSKGKLVNKIESQPLETYLYNYIFQSYDKNILQTDFCFLNQVEQKEKYLTILIFNIDTISLVKQICMNIINQLPMVFQLQNISNTVLSEISTQLFTIYFYNRQQYLKWYFQSLMNQSVRKGISADLIKQIAIVEKERQQYKTETVKIQNQKEASDKKKRQKMLNIRKEKTDMIRKKQQQFLMGVQSKMDQQNKPQLSNCIYCKQAKQQSLNYISYVGFTGLIQKGILKNNVHPKNHLHFTTCGHKIHQSCYISAAENNLTKFCFLCKRETNLLIPEISLMNNIGLSQKQVKIKDILSNIVPILIGDLDEQNTQTYFQLISQIESEENTFMYFLYGFVRELVYTGLQDFKYFCKSQYHLYYQIFQIIMSRPKYILQSTFTKINQHYDYNISFLESKINSLQRYIMVLLQTSLVMKIDDTNHKFLINLSQFQIQQAHKIVSLFTAEKPVLDLNFIQNLNMIQMTNLFISIPQHLNQLHNKMGKCFLCPNITNQIYMCLLCGWSACIKCKKMFFKHSSTDHIGGSIFIACFNGGIKFFYGENVFQDDSIYQNYLGTSYCQATSLEEISKPEKFKLNNQKLQEIYKTVLFSAIHQKVFDNK